MRKTWKFLHTLAACGVIGALLGYAVLLAHAPQDTPEAYAAMRQSISALCDYILFPSLAVVLITGLLAMAAHHPFVEMRWVWLKALMGLGMFEGTLAVIGSKANDAAAIAARIADGGAEEGLLAAVLAYEWHSLGVLIALAAANVLLGVWRPGLKARQRSARTG